jgi:hypothetical protein
MRLDHTIRYKDAEKWKAWCSTYIGVKGVDYFPVAEKVVTEWGHDWNSYWEIPDSKKAILWALRWT